MPARSAALVLLGALLATACHRESVTYPKTPELALGEIERVVTSADAVKAWAIVDPQTRTTVSEVRRAASTSADDKAFFARTTAGWSQLEGYRKRLGSVSGPILVKPDGERAMWVSRSDGMPFHLLKVGDGWAWQDLRAEWIIERDRVSKKAGTP